MHIKAGQCRCVFPTSPVSHALDRWRVPRMGRIHLRVGGGLRVQLTWLHDNLVLCGSLLREGRGSLRKRDRKLGRQRDGLTDRGGRVPVGTSLRARKAFRWRNRPCCRWHHFLKATNESTRVLLEHRAELHGVWRHVGAIDAAHLNDFFVRCCAFTLLSATSLGTNRGGVANVLMC